MPRGKAVGVVNDTLTGSYDVAVLRRHIIVLSANQARRVLNNVNQAIEPGGAIYIIGHVTDASRVSPREAVGINLRFINIFDEGQAHPEQEIRDWLTEAGFEGIELVMVSNGESIMSARKRRLPITVHN